MLLVQCESETNNRTTEQSIINDCWLTPFLVKTNQVGRR